MRRTSCGSRPAASAAPSTILLPSRSSCGVSGPSDGNQPSGLRPASRSIRGLNAPSHADRVRSGRAGARVVEPVVAAGEGDRALVRPHQADDVDPLLDLVHALPGAAALGAQAGDAGREGTAAEAELESAAADGIERRCRPRQTAGGRSGRLATSVTKPIRRVSAIRVAIRANVSKKWVLVGVVLDGDQPEAARVGRPGELADAGQLVRVGDDRDPRYHVVLISTPSMKKVAPVMVLVAGRRAWRPLRGW